jgi:TolA-binding protein
MISTARKLQGEMNNRVESLRKESKSSEMDKLNFLEERYNNQIRRYEAKIIENEKMINEMHDLVTNYEEQVKGYVTEIDEKQAVIDDLSKSRERLDLIIHEMEKDLKAKQSENLAGSVVCTPAGSKYFSMIRSPGEQEFRPVEFNSVSSLNTEMKIERAINERDLVHRDHLRELESNAAR